MTSSIASGCPDDNDIAEYAAHALPPDRQRIVEAHFSGCARCREVVASLLAPPTSLSAVSARAPLVLLDVDPSRYELRRELAHGGMGRIYEAWDTRHGRTVALKMLLHAGDAAARRFEREARITARLQHPSIVPLYEAGRWSAGEPFFAMKLVAGRSLADVIAGTKNVAERVALLPHLVAVCEAIAYAHDRGIVHRDLKPANILMGAYGETVVIDWGLATELGGPASSKRTEHAPGADRDAALTGVGQAIGTPSYMAPEQARGDERLDARADVYALGALLYHLFAGQPPYVGSSSDETLGQVLGGPPEPLARRAPELPADLVTLVEKAMARDPADRYPTAKQLADDLERFTSGKLVTAHSYSLGVLLRRWADRHRAVLAVAATLLLALAVTGAFSVRRIARERDRADVAKLGADRERASAITQRDAAEKLVEFLIGSLRRRLEGLGKIDLLAGLGREVEEYYGRTSPSDDMIDADALMRRGSALDALVGVEDKKRDFVAEESLARARVAIYERALARDPKHSEARAGLALAHAQLGRALSYRNQHDESERECMRAAELARALVADDPDPRFRATWATASGLLSVVRSDRGDMAGAREAVAAAREAMPPVDDVFPSGRPWIDTMATGFAHLGITTERLNDAEASERAYAACVDVRRRELGSDPENADMIDSLARCLVGLAWAQEELGSYGRARATYAEATPLRRALVDREPQNHFWKRELWLARWHECMLAWKVGPLVEATEPCADALVLARARVVARPDDAWSQRDLAASLRAVGRLARDQGQADAGLSACRESLDVAVRVSARDPKNRLFRHDVVESRKELARAQLAQRDVDAALASIRTAVAEDEAQLAGSPDDAAVIEDLGALRVNLGDVLRAHGDRSGATDAYARARRDLEGALARDNHEVEAKLSLGEACAKLSSLLTGATASDARACALRWLESLEREHRLDARRAAVLRGLR